MGAVPVKIVGVRRGLTIACLLTAGSLTGQTLEVHSEFLRVNPQGEILSLDKDPKPREILSPAMVRNGFTSFHIVVRSERPASFFLFASANPPNVLQTKIYRERFVKRGEDWIPDTLELLEAPNFGAIPDSDGIPGQTAAAYLLDVWTPPDAPPATIRIEAQLKVADWVIYPMEVRVLTARVPEIAETASELPAIEMRADESAAGPLLAFLDKPGEIVRKRREERIPHTLREVIRRNAEQDIALARQLEAQSLAPALKQKIASSRGGGEWYLGVRDLIYRFSTR